MKVFLVDDSDHVIQRLSRMIAVLPGVVVMGHASDIPAALQAIRAESPDLVVLDLHLPSGSGIKVLQVIKREKPTTRVIVHTNYAFPQYQKKCIESGADAFLDKSKDFDKIPRVIQELARHQRSRGKTSAASVLTSPRTLGLHSPARIPAKAHLSLKTPVAVRNKPSSS